ncbi:hypothetical protein ACFYPT_38935 [Streptomyces sp. NPDC005529]|uniref:hypothetical protein n=1 Tax=unclassified Streptomyces TaxID=2593676 RepID=UPI0033B2A7E8
MTFAAVLILITAQGNTDDSALGWLPDWPAAFEDTDRILADLAHNGRLARRLRAVLTDHLLDRLTPSRPECTGRWPRRH